ncbi:hypothetical protein IF1G_06624 [Cordyceps javanica]|uniref:Uncharacterized protein n=1 Tax=Cordyceps javanica TaxID=43265 RepID=A0A545UYU5_9HYPO|nr:hypothetical protein IF1G_06624 [Cordyceps javanica]
MSSASRRFSTIPDLLSLLCDQVSSRFWVNNRRLLLDLCLVDRGFCDVFSRKLWRRLEFTENNFCHLIDEGRRQQLLRSDKLCHVRGLVIRQPKMDLEDDDDTSTSDAIVQLLEHIPNLKRFAHVAVLIQLLLDHITYNWQIVRCETIAQLPYCTVVDSEP